MRKFFKSKLFRKITIGIIAIVILVSPIIAAAQMGGGISVAQYFKRVDTALQPTNSAWTLGSTGTPIANGYFTALTAGTLTISSTVSGDLSVGGVIKTSNGTAAVPSYSFTSDPDTGIYSGGANIIGFAANGNYVGAITDSWMRAVAFTSYSVYSVDMVGQIPNGATAIGAKIGNANSLTTAGAKIVSFYSDNKTTEKAAIGLGGEVMAGAGTALLPSLSFLGAPNTGFYYPGSGYIAVASNGGHVGYWSNAVGTHGVTGMIQVNNLRTLGATLNIEGTPTDGATAIGVYITSNTILTVAGAKIASFRNNTAEKAYISKDGTFGSVLGAVTLGAAATTFAAAGNVKKITGDAGGNTLATITAGVTGQTLTLIFVDALVTITDDATSGANTVNLSAAFTSTAADVLMLVFDGVSWRETSRSVN